MVRSIKDSLQIIIISYNRSKYLARTLTELTAPASPVRDFVSLKLKKNSFVVGFCNVISDLRDPKLKAEAVKRLMVSVASLFNLNSPEAYLEILLKNYTSKEDLPSLISLKERLS